MRSNSPSFERVDYTVRPAKNIERKMMAEMFSRLGELRKVEAYKYVGLGSTFFSDFVLFHKLLGITDLVSIEKEVEHKNRITFNKPYNCIQVEFGDTTDVLPRLDWREPAIVWLDYDDRINARKLDDIVYLAENFASASFLAVTLPAFPETFLLGSPPALPRRLERMRAMLEGKVPDSWRPRDVLDLPKAQKGIANALIVDALARRNAALKPDDKIYYEQALFFRYADSTPMMTFGGFFLTQRDSRLLKRARLGDLPFFKQGDIYYHLDPPKLTIRERRLLDTQLPGSNARCPGVSRGFVDKYAQLYRYFPYFVEAEV